MENVNIKLMVDSIRKRTGLNQCELAGRIGVTQPTISRILSGKQSGVSLKNYMAIKEVLDKVEQ